MNAAFGAMHDAVPGAHDERLAVLPQQALAIEHEEDLLVGPVVMGRSGEVPRGDLDAAQADVAAARFTAEIVPDAFDVADRELPTDPVVDIPGSYRHRRDAISRCIGLDK